MKVFMVFYLISGCTTALNLTNLNNEEFGQKLIKNLLKNQDGLSENCINETIQYIFGLLTLKIWALSMFDSSSKINSGLLSSNVINLGSYDQCIAIKQEEIRGKFCIGFLSSPKTDDNFSTFQIRDSFVVNEDKNGIGLPWALCVPDSCTDKDVKKIMLFFDLDFTEDKGYCQSESTAPNMNIGHFFIIIFLSLFLLISIISTICDLRHPEAETFLKSFSITSNLNKLFTIQKNRTELSCIYGLRTISMMWIILGHRYTSYMTTPITNYIEAYNWLNSKKSMFIIGATVSVDTFFVISGTVLVYTYRKLKDSGVKFNILKFYLHRYIRLTPLLLIVIIFHLTFLVFIGSGPLWASMIRTMITPCENYWWSTLLYIQNYFNFTDMCIQQSWYLAVDMQLYLLSPILLIPLTGKPKLILISIAILSLLSAGAAFLVAWTQEFGAFIISSENLVKYNEYMKYYYMMVYTRATPWFFGLILGYFLYDVKTEKRTFELRTNLQKNIVLITWIITISIGASCIFLGHNLLFDKYDKIANSLHVMLVRPAWSLCIVWLIFACVNYGGPINYFLSLPIFEFLSKFTYSLYLIHFTVINVVTDQIRRPEEFTFLAITYRFCGDYILSLLSAMILCVLFESPLIAITK